MTEYVAGLLFSVDETRVALIQKRRPSWQAGRLNGIGGHVEPRDVNHRAAMTREFIEETGVDVEWTHFCTLKGQTWTVEWYKAFADADIKTMTDETVGWYLVNEVLSNVPAGLPIIPNVRWLVLLALDKDNVTAVVTDPSL